MMLPHERIGLHPASTEQLRLLSPFCVKTLRRGATWISVVSTGAELRWPERKRRKQTACLLVSWV